jgi:YjjG family noncanonical pyrimidine nucleotidase
MTFTTLLFDFDHTLFDSNQSEALAFADTLQFCEIPEDPTHFATYKKINQALWDQVELGSISPNDLRTKRFADFIAHIGSDVDPHHMADRFGFGMGANGELYPGARQVLEQLAESATLALVTNALSEIQRARIDRVGIADLFDAVIISGEVGASKPGTAIFDITFDALKNPPKETTLMIGDSLTSDIQGGANYGITTCWFNPHNKPPGAAPTPAHTIADLQELPDLVGAWHRS